MGAAGVSLFDFKSAMREDLPERYMRQLQLYAYLWWEVYGEWPVAAHVVYPLTATTHEVPVDPGVCQDVAEEAKSVLRTALAAKSPDALAQPGDVCKVCEFRPWCKAFWRWQADEATQSVVLERADLGFEGVVEKITCAASYWRIQVRWREALVEIVAPEERFPQLRRASVGTTVRCLDMKLYGLRHSPKARVSEMSEIFLLGV